MTEFKNAESEQSRVMAITKIVLWEAIFNTFPPFAECIITDCKWIGSS
jgi:hypothetical protein